MSRAIGEDGDDVRSADPALLAGRLSYYRAVGEEFALWCPEDVYVAEPAALIAAYLAACRARGVVVAVVVVAVIALDTRDFIARPHDECDPLVQRLRRRFENGAAPAP